MIRLDSTTNEKFKFLEGQRTGDSNFKIGTVVWFEDFHTSNIQKIEYTYFKYDVEIKVYTLNSEYVFVVEGVKL